MADKSNDILKQNTKIQEIPIIKDDNCYIVDNTGAVLAIMSPDVTVSILKQMEAIEKIKKNARLLAMIN